MSQVIHAMIDRPVLNLQAPIEQRLGRGRDCASRQLKADAERGRCPRIIGVLLRIVEGKGFGFIRPDDGSQEYFAHVTAFRDRNLFFEGARVSFRPGEPPGGRKAPPALDVDQASEEGNPDENDD